MPLCSQLGAKTRDRLPWGAGLKYGHVPLGERFSCRQCPWLSSRKLGRQGPQVLDPSGQNFRRCRAQSRRRGHGSAADRRRGVRWSRGWALPGTPSPRAPPPLGASCTSLSRAEGSAPARSTHTEPSGCSQNQTNTQPMLVWELSSKMVKKQKPAPGPQHCCLSPSEQLRYLSLKNRKGKLVELRLGCWGAELSGRWGVKVLGCWDGRVSEC